MKRLLRLQFRLTLLLSVLLSPSLFAQIAVVVHPDNSVTDISLSDLKRIYLGKVTSYESGDAIVLTGNQKLDEAFYQQVLDMSVRRVRKHWMKVVFEGEYATPPTAFDDLAELRKFINRNKGAIGFVKLSDVDSTLKMLTVEGLDPEAEDYPLLSDEPENGDE